MTTRRRWLLGAATLTTGLNAGVYFGWATGVMPGLANTTDHTFVETMNDDQRRHRQPGVHGRADGSPGADGDRGVHGEGRDAALALAALGANVATFFVTMAANVPLNDTLSAVDLATDNLRRAREDFETPWAAWNIVRTATSTAATALLVRALLPRIIGPRSCLDRPRNLDARGDVELVEDVAQMRLHGLAADEERRRDLGVGTPVHDEVGDLPLAVGSRTSTPTARQSPGALRRWTC